MLIASWSNFVGANLRVHPKRLAEGIGANAVNLRLGSGDFRTWRAPATVVTTGGATPLISAYRMNRTVASDTGAWLQWTTDVDVVRSLIAQDTTEEIYYTGDGPPKRTDNVIGMPANPGPAAWRSLGIPKPTAAMTATILAAGTGTDQSRVYVDVFVNNQGRESAPGLPRSITTKPDSTVTLAGFDPAPSGYPDLTQRFVYVSVDGAEYRRCAEIAIGATTVVDTGARGAILQSGGSTSKPSWEMPPDDLRGLIALHGSMIGGFRGKEFAVCVPGKPWAWPVQYRDTVFDDIVATGRWGSNWVLLTTSTPVVLRGGPELFDKQYLPFNQACVSKRSVVNMGNGVIYASPNGLCMVGEGGARILTAQALSPEQWQELNPSTMIGARVEGFYVGFFNDGTPRALMVDPIDPRVVIFLTVGARGQFYDPISDRLYLQDVGNVIRRWNAPISPHLLGAFLTSVMRHECPTNPGFAMVVADEPESVVVTLRAEVLQGDGTRVWTNVFSRTVVSGEPFSLPSGYLAQDFQVQMQTAGPVQGFLLAEDVGDLV